MGLLDKFVDIGKNVGKIWHGGTRVLSGDWKGFTSVSSGVQGLFSNKDASGKIFEGYSDAYKPSMNLSGYGVDTHSPGSSGKINQLGDVDNIPKWSRNQAVALYYLNMINKITTQGSNRKGA